MPITVNSDNTTYLETEIDGKMYMTQAQVSKTNATFKYTGCTPEEIEKMYREKRQAEKEGRKPIFKNIQK